MHHRGREQPAPRVLRTAGQKRPGGAFLGRGRVPNRVHQSRHLARNCGVFFCCNFPRYCGQVHHRGREQPAPRVLRTAGQKRPGGAFLGRGRVPNRVHQSRHLARNCGVFFCCNFPRYCGQVHHRGREQPAPRVLRTAGQKRPGGAFLGRGRVPNRVHQSRHLARSCGVFFYCDFPRYCG